MRDLYDQFLCACLRRDRDEASVPVNNPRWNWDLLFQRANDHAVLPALNSAVRDSGIDAFVPAEVTDFFSGIESLNCDHNLAIFAELKVVADLLNSIGLEPVLLKGAAYLASGVYDKSGERYMLDLDLLIPEAHLNSAAGLLMRNGFLQDDSDNFGRFRHHHHPLRRRGSIFIELHHGLGLGPFASLLTATEVIDRSLPHNCEGSKVRLPCPEHLMTHLILHSQMFNPYNERIWPPIRAMYDLSRLNCRFGAAINWSSIEERFGRTGQDGLLKLHLLQVQESLGGSFPVDLSMTLAVTLRWFRRKLLRTFPALRYVDPVYMFSVLCLRRLRLLRIVLNHSGGLKYLLGRMLHRPVYRRLLSDMLNGYGR